MRRSTTLSQAGAYARRGDRVALATIRHHAAPPLAWLGTLFYAAWQLLAEQKLFVHALLSGGRSLRLGERVAAAPALRARTLS